MSRHFRAEHHCYGPLKKLQPGHSGRWPTQFRPSKWRHRRNRGMPPEPHITTITTVTVPMRCPKVTKVTIWWPSDPARSPCTKPSPWPSPRASRWMRQSLAELRGISINVYSLLLKMVIDSWFTYLKWWFSIDIVCLPKGRCPLALLSRSISFFDMWKMRI